MSHIVIVVPGSMASALYDQNDDLVWINPLRMIGQGVEALAIGNTLSPYGSVFGYMNYLALHVSLVSSIHSCTIEEYDWRQSVVDSSKSLTSLIVGLANHGFQVSVITHSLGSLLARHVIQNLPDSSMIKNLIMLGPCISGTFLGCLAVAGDIGEIPFAKFFNIGNQYLQGVLAGFPALYEVMPCNSDVFPWYKAGYSVDDPSFWLGIPNINIKLLQSSIDFASKIDSSAVNDRTILILGNPDNNATCGGVQVVDGQFSVNHDYDMPGDHFIAHTASLIPGVETHLIDGVGHLALPLSRQVIDLVVSILSR